MDLELIRNHCVSKWMVTEEFPFDSKTLVFKVQGKMFALLDIENFKSVNLKCDPERAVELRERYHAVVSAYHMNKKHWNTVSVCEDLNRDDILELIDHSYDLVVKQLPKKLRDGIEIG